MHALEPAPVPDVAGRDLSPTDRAAALAHQLEAENSDRLRKLAGFGVDPNGFAFAAISCRLEALIECLPPANRALVEVTYETGFAHVLQAALDDIGRPKLLTPSGQ